MQENGITKHLFCIKSCKWILCPLLLIHLLISCKKPIDSENDTAKYDLFPLKTGNEFFYKYMSGDLYGACRTRIEGSEVWKILSSYQGIYKVQRNLSGLKIRDCGSFWGDTVIILDSIRFLEIFESNTSLISFSLSDYVLTEVEFNRFQDIPLYEIKEPGSTVTPTWSFTFKSDSGLTSYKCFGKPNKGKFVTLTLDSISE